jgi:sulfate adenylyltransferase subunit 1
MDMVGYDKNVFTKIVSQYQDVARELQLEDVYYIPISALKGDNIITNSLNLAWFEGNSLLTHLENIEVIKSKNSVSRFSVQYVIRPQAEELHDYRGYAGKISSGTYSKDDEVRVFPSGISSSIKQIEVNQKEVQTAYAGQSVTIHLQDDIDISRGDVIVRSNQLPKIQNEFEVLMCWMDSNELNAGNRYILQHGSRRVKALVRDIQYKLDVNTLSKESYPGAVKLNDVVKATIKTAEPLAFDSYLELPVNGSAILIDQTSNMTVGACLIQ